MSVHINPDKCIACTTCVVHCPVADATPKFLGPRMIGPAYERFRLLGLTEVRRALGLPNSLNEPLFMARTSVWVVGDQLLNTQTFINDITYNLPGGRLDVSWRDERIVCSASHSGAPAIFSARGAGYEEALRDAAASMTGLLAGLLSVEVPAIRFDLSGGQDSRLVLAAALAGKADPLGI